MNRKISIGPKQIKPVFSVLNDYLVELKAVGVPDEARIRIETSAAGDALTINVEYVEDYEPQAAADPEVYSRRRGAIQAV